MQNVVIDKPYVFVPPVQGRFWPWLLQKFVPWYLDRKFGVAKVECRGLDRLQGSVAAGDGVLLAPNHCRPYDPLVVQEMARQAGVLPFVLASWHVFMQGRVQAWFLRHSGGFSIYREGMDRAAVGAAIDIVAAAQRPLTLFPEGVVSRTNDRLGALMEGTSFIARAAAKKRAAASPPGRVVAHPIALRYHFRGDLERSLQPTLTELERRLSWRPQSELPLPDRIIKLGLAILALKEMEYFGSTRSGSLAERLEGLIDHLLAPLEREWLQGKREKTAVARVKRLRTAILPDMARGEVSDEERQRRWRQLADMYLAQQVSFYPSDYIASSPTPDRLLETVERLEEDLTDACRAYRPVEAIVTIGEAIVVSPERDRGAKEDPLLEAIEQQLKRMLAATSEARPAEAVAAAVGAAEPAGGA